VAAEEARRVRDRRAAGRDEETIHIPTGTHDDNLQRQVGAPADAGNLDGAENPAAVVALHRGAPLRSRRGNHAQQRYPPFQVEAVDNKHGRCIPPKPAAMPVLPSQSISSWSSFSNAVRPVAASAALYLANTGLLKVLLFAGCAIRCEGYSEAEAIDNPIFATYILQAKETYEDSMPAIVARHSVRIMLKC
jgi:hypothetical protein